MGRFSLAQVKSIHAQFNHIDPRSRCVREFLARCTAPKALESNPKCEISSRGRIDAQPPVVLLEYGAQRGRPSRARAPCAAVRAERLTAARSQ